MLNQPQVQVSTPNPSSASTSEQGSAQKASSASSVMTLLLSAKEARLISSQTREPLDKLKAMHQCTLGMQRVTYAHTVGIASIRP